MLSVDSSYARSDMIWVTVVEDSLSDIRGMDCDDIPLEGFRFSERPARYLRCKILLYSIGVK